MIFIKSIYPYHRMITPGFTIDIALKTTLQNMYRKATIYPYPI